MVGGEGIIIETRHDTINETIVLLEAKFSIILNVIHVPGKEKGQ